MIVACFGHLAHVAQTSNSLQQVRAFSSVGRASRLHRGGRRFKSFNAHHYSKANYVIILL